MSTQTDHAVRSAIVRSDNSEGGGDKLDKLLTALGTITDRLDKLEKRSDSDGLTNAKEGESLDKLLTHLDAKLDAFEKKHCERMDAFGKRMDAFEHKDGKPEEKKEEEGKPTPLAADKKHDEEKEEEKMDGELQKGEESEKKSLSEEREENSLKANDSVAVTNLRAKMAEIEKRIPVEMPEEARQNFVTAQARAERIAQAFGDSQGAPRWLNGELLDQYRRRLIGKYKGYSKQWAEVDLTPFAGKALDTVEKQVYADAHEAAIHPVDGAAGTLREVLETDRTGRRISRFYGDPEACWGMFKLPAQRLTRVGPPPRMN